MKNYLLVMFLLLASLAFGQVTVTVSSPTAGSSVASPVNVVAEAKSTKTITAWHIYADGVNVFGGPLKSDTINTNLNLSAGQHNLQVRAWDSSGAYGDEKLAVTVANNVGPTAPANATAISNVQSLNNWQSCDTPICSGSKSGASGSWWYALNNTTPSVTGASAEFHVDGTAGENVLWHRGMPVIAGDTRAHFIYDYWVYMPAGSTNHVWSFEHDIIGLYNGRKYNFSTQCHITSYANHAAHWDTYDGYNHHWIHTPISCAALIDTGKWHHIKIAGERTSDLRNHYLSFTTDGVTTAVPTAYAWFATLPSNWASHWTLQVQINLMTGNSGSTEYYDKANLFVF